MSTETKVGAKFACWPLPWTLIDRENEGLEIRAADGDPVVENFDAYGESQRDTEALGVLIAAAPDLLAACEALIGSRQGIASPYTLENIEAKQQAEADAWQAIRAAISKARGTA